MRRLLIFLVALQIAHCSCPSGFDLVRDGECRGNYTKMSVYKDSSAATSIASKCKEIDAQPIIIHNEEQQSYWLSQVKDVYTSIGLLCNATTKKWEWTDGSPLDYKPSNHAEALDNECTAVNYDWIIHVGDGRWTAYNGGQNVTTDVFCTTRLPPLPVLSGDGCKQFEDDRDDGVCYQVATTAENWQDAQMICKKVGANLASIHSDQENSFIRRLAVSKGDVFGVYLGATLSGKGAQFGWIDGSEWDYDNFSPGFPRTGFGDCVALDTSTPAGQWMNIDCSSKIPVACIREQGPVVEPVCSTETWKEGSIITSPGFPYSASTPCDYYLMVDEGKKVELEVVLLEANSCCDSLIVYDGYFGGIVMANLTGEIRNSTFITTSTNIMKVSWQPNGGVNVLGLAMTFRGV